MNKYNPDDVIVVKTGPAFGGIEKEKTVPKHAACFGLGVNKENPSIIQSVDMTVYERTKNGALKKVKLEPYKCQCGETFKGKPSVAARRFQQHIQKCKKVKNENNRV